MTTDPTKTKSHVLDRNLYLIFSITLIAIMGVSSITPAFPSISKELNITASETGWLITIFTLPGVVLTLFLGILADHWGRKRVIVPSLFLFGVAGCACAFTRTFEWLLVFRFFQGIGASALGSLNMTLIGDLYAGQRRTTAMGYNASVLSIGTASYPVIGGALAAIAWYAPFFLPLLGIPVGLAVWFKLRNPEPKNRDHFLTYLKEVWQKIKNRNMICLMIANLSIFIVLYGAYLTFYPFLIKNRFAGSSVIIGLVMSCMSLTTALASSQAGRLARVFSEQRLIKAGFFIYAIAMVIVPFVDSIWALLIPTIIFGIGHGILFPSVQSLLTGMAPMQQRAGIMSLNGMILRLGQTLGPMVMGISFSMWELNGVFFTGAVYAFAVFLLCLFSIRKF